MKQYITKEQWMELTDKEKDTLLNHKYTFKEFDYSKLTIGQMIEFLGDDIKNHCFKGDLMITDDFVDSLWEIIKHKLKK